MTDKQEQNARLNAARYSLMTAMIKVAHADFSNITGTEDRQVAQLIWESKDLWDLCSEYLYTNDDKRFDAALNTTKNKIREINSQLSHLEGGPK